MTSGFREIEFGKYCTEVVKVDHLLHSDQRTCCINGRLFLEYKIMHSDQWVVQDLKTNCNCKTTVKLELE